jgi:predicted permease
MSWLSRLTSTLRPSRLRSDLDDELQFHIDRRTDELIAQGIPHDEARREAARRFGNQTLMKENARDRDVLVWLETALQDIRYAFRTLRRNPGFAATAILSLALGIGANTALFSIADALLLKRLPVRDPQSLVTMDVHSPRYGRSTFSYGLFDSIRKNSRLLSGVAATALGGNTIREQNDPVPARVEIASGEYFDVLGVSASRGRVFHDAKEPLAVISDEFWRAHYASGEVIGNSIKVGATVYKIIGITSEGFRGANVDWPTDVWIPLEQAVPSGARRGATWNWLEVIARMAPGSTLPEVSAEMNALQREFLEREAGKKHFDHPQERAGFLDETTEVTSGATGLSNLRVHYVKPLMIVVSIAAMVLLIACANLANLLLARAAAREREMATRRAIGAGRARLIRQLLTECGVVVIAGAAGAILIARWLSGALLAFIPDAEHALPNLSFHLDPRLLIFMLAISATTCVLAGVAPAIRASGPARAYGSSGGRSLIAVEVALCTILLIGSGWFVRTLWNLRTLDAGFVRGQVLLSTVSAPKKGPEAAARFDDLRARLTAVPGVRSVGYSNYPLMIGDVVKNDVDVEGHQPDKTEDISAIELNISPGFFAALGTPMVTGRDFQDRDGAGAPKVVIVNEAFARRFFGSLNAVGKHVGDNGPKSVLDYEIVGVVKNTKYTDLREQPRPIYYRPFSQTGTDNAMVIAVRSSGDPGMLVNTVRDIIHQTDPRVNRIMRFSTLIDASLASESMVAQLSAGFGGLALLVACIGIYGILAYRVARRAREIGVRIALGASRGGVQWMIVRESLALLAIGIAIGIPVALGLSRYVKSLLYGLTPADPSTMAMALAVLAMVSIAAAFLPARRAARIDPMKALRCD